MDRSMNAGVVQRMPCVLVAIGLSGFLLIGAQADDNLPAPAASAQDEPAQQTDAPLSADDEVRERGFPFKTPGVLEGSGAQHLRYAAPTPSLTEIANALPLRHKSLTTLMTVAHNLPVTTPVEISIGYSSPAGVQAHYAVIRAYDRQSLSL